MELRHLRYFVAVAEELHFRRAAERLHMSQPPLSLQIRALEQELGVTLLRRDRRGVALTDAGRAFLPEARAVLRSAEHAALTAQRVASGEQGALSVGFVGSTMYGRVPQLLRRFREERPDVQIRLRELRPAEQMEGLRTRDIDIGFLRPPLHAVDVTVHMLFEESMVVALPSEHRLAARRRIAVRDLRDESGVAAAIETLLADAGVAPHVVQEATELPTAIGLVAAGFGVSFVPESLTALQRPGVVYRPLTGRARKARFAIAHRTGDQAPLVQAFVALARA
jgi:DNA-binding transcriptional LysR family regulator